MVRLVLLHTINEYNLSIIYIKQQNYGNRACLKRLPLLNSNVLYLFTYLNPNKTIILYAMYNVIVE